MELARFQVLTAFYTQYRIFGIVMSCVIWRMFWCFRGIYCLHLQGRSENIRASDKWKHLPVCGLIIQNVLRTWPEVSTLLMLQNTHWTLSSASSNNFTRRETMSHWNEFLDADELYNCSYANRHCWDKILPFQHQIFTFQTNMFIK